MNDRNYALFCKWIDRWDKPSDPELFDSYKRHFAREYKKSDSKFTDNELEMAFREYLGEIQ